MGTCQNGISLNEHFIFKQGNLAPGFSLASASMALQSPDPCVSLCYRSHIKVHALTHLLKKGFLIPDLYQFCSLDQISYFR